MYSVAAQGIQAQSHTTPCFLHVPGVKGHLCAGEVFTKTDRQTDRRKRLRESEKVENSFVCFFCLVFFFLPK